VASSMCRPSLMSVMPYRRLQDRIRELCARSLYETGPQWEITVHQLQLAIQEHALRLNNMAAAATMGGRPEVFTERRERER
jgi:hypothetical protein